MRCCLVQQTGQVALGPGRGRARPLPGKILDTSKLASWWTHFWTHPDLWTHPNWPVGGTRFWTHPKLVVGGAGFGHTLISPVGGGLDDLDKARHRPLI